MKINEIIQGDCLAVLKTLPENSVDSIVTDPPYEIGFMGKIWDNSGITYNIEMWKEALRVLKPGGHLLSFGGSRTYHRMACVIEDAGFEIRDQIMWVYGSGFPKSFNIGKVIDKESIQWEGWGTALKPAHEPICMARKPLAEKTVAENVLKWGVGGINIDGCRVGAEERTCEYNIGRNMKPQEGWNNHNLKSITKTTIGRFPANLIHDGSEEVVGLFPNTKSGARSSKHDIGNKDGEMFNHGIYGKFKAKPYDDAPADSGSAARYFQVCPPDSRLFYSPKASKRERDMGCEGLEEKRSGSMVDNVNDGDFLTGSGNPRRGVGRNNHPTVKPLALMEYLIKLVTPPKGIVLDLFMGSGTTACAARKNGFNFLGIELSPEYIQIAEARIKTFSADKQELEAGKC